MATYRPTGWASSLINLEITSDIQDAQYIKGKMFRAMILANRVSGKLESRSQFIQIATDRLEEPAKVRGTAIATLGIRNKSMAYRSNNQDMYLPWMRQAAIMDYESDIRGKDYDKFVGNKGNPPSYTAGRSGDAEGRVTYGIDVYGKRKKIQHHITDNYSAIKDDVIKFYFKGNGFDQKYQVLTLPFIPRELQFTPENNVIPIATPGRNTPFYQYTGSEDTLEFSIDWVSLDPNNNKEDVIANCRHLEAMSKNNAYTDKPAKVSIEWGAGDKLFKDIHWIIEKAPYKLQNFNKGYKDQKTGSYVSTSLLPVQAYQQITLKRVDDHNTTRKELFY